MLAVLERDTFNDPIGSLEFIILRTAALANKRDGSESNSGCANWYDHSEVNIYCDCKKYDGAPTLFKAYTMTSTSATS